MELVNLQSNSTPQFSPVAQAITRCGSQTQVLLKSWRESVPERDLLKLGINYDSLYHSSKTVTLPSFDIVAHFALQLDQKRNTEWDNSPRLKQGWEAWQSDSAKLGRPPVISLLVGYSELAYLVAHLNPSGSTSSALDFVGFSEKRRASLARFEFVPFNEDLELAQEKIAEILMRDVFPRDFASRWDRELSSQTTPPAPRVRFEKLPLTPHQLLEILDPNGNISLSFLSRVLSNTETSRHAASGTLEVLLAGDSTELSQNLSHLAEMNFWERRRKGRFDPHVSAIVRSLFGLNGEDITDLPAKTVYSLESVSDQHATLLEAVISSAENKLRPIIFRAVNTLIDCAPNLEELSLFETTRRAKEGGMIVPGVIGRDRLKDITEELYVPPLFQLKRLFNFGKLAAHLEIKQRLHSADKAPENHSHFLCRFVDSIATEHAETRNAFRAEQSTLATDHESSHSLWKKSTFERFFRSLGTSNFQTEKLQQFIIDAPIDEPSRQHFKRLVDIYSIDTPDYSALISKLMSLDPALSPIISKGLQAACNFLNCWQHFPALHGNESFEEALGTYFALKERIHGNKSSGAAKDFRSFLRRFPGINTLEIQELIQSRGIKPHPRRSSFPPTPDLRTIIAETAEHIKSLYSPDYDSEPKEERISVVETPSLDEDSQKRLLEIHSLVHSVIDQEKSRPEELRNLKQASEISQNRRPTSERLVDKRNLLPDPDRLEIDFDSSWDSEDEELPTEPEVEPTAMEEYLAKKSKNLTEYRSLADRNIPLFEERGEE